MPLPESADFSLDARAGLPEELLRLRQMYPRDSWAEHPNLGDWVRFWLDRHAMFRDVGAVLSEACQQLQDGRICTAEFSAWLAPRLEFQFGHLDLHHRIEEAHIFPAFARAEPTLARGFALLEADHQDIHALIDAVQTAATGFAAVAPSDDGGLRVAGATLQRHLAVLQRALNAHLNDEEDLIVPIVLDRSEAALGLF